MKHVGAREGLIVKDVLTAVARVMALENGAAFTVVPGVAYDVSDAALGAMAQALLERFDGTGIDLVALERQGSTLVAHINEDMADEPLCPAAFDRVVHRLSYDLLGEVWAGKVKPTFTFTPSPIPAPLVRVA
jgi:hypothetical protein